MATRPRATRPSATRPTKRRDSASLQFWLISLRASIGVTLFGGFPAFSWGIEGTLFTLVWPYAYWEVFRAGMVCPMGYSGPFDSSVLTYQCIYHMPVWGTSIGVPLPLDATGRHRLRFGIHLSFFYLIDPRWSGFELYYTYRVNQHVGIEFGMRQHSLPLAFLFFAGVAFGSLDF